MVGLWFRMFRGDRTGFKETMLEVMLLQEIWELKIELLMQAQENRVDLDEEQLLFLAGGQTNTFDDNVDEGPFEVMAQNEDNNFQADQCDAYDSDVDEAPTA
nr:integrase, catalytic region, zinc finger, CCHC-type, peptidase aspartic, catalytic [Tanacetum cinerariifolium]